MLVALAQGLLALRDNLRDFLVTAFWGHDLLRRALLRKELPTRQGEQSHNDNGGSSWTIHARYALGIPF